MVKNLYLWKAAKPPAVHRAENDELLGERNSEASSNMANSSGIKRHICI